MFILLILITLSFNSIKYLWAFLNAKRETVWFTPSRQKHFQFLFCALSSVEEVWGKKKNLKTSEP